MKLMDLNTDVLDIILSLISRDGALQLTRTCRAAYTFALPRVLYQVHLLPKATRPERDRIRQLRRLIAFCTFVLADAPHRAPCVKVLKFDGSIIPGIDSTVSDDHPEDHPTRLISDVLRLTTQLRELYLIEVGHMASMSSYFADALAALPKLDVLRLISPGDAVFDALPRMASSLKELTFRILDATTQDSGWKAYCQAMQSPKFTKRLKILPLNM